MLALANVDIAVLQEVKIVNPQFAPRRYAGYGMVTVAAGRDTNDRAGGAFGGVALLVREDDRRFVVENAEVVGKNVISCEVVTGSGGKEGEETRWFVVGFYRPPSETDGAAQRLVEKTLETRPPGTRPLPIGDLNANLDVPRG